MKRIKLISLLAAAVTITLAASWKNIYAGQNAPSVIIPETVSATAGETFTLPVTIKIPEGTYIYANPKGPGIGKATTITVKLPDGFELLTTGYPAGEKYTPAGFNEHVFIWKKNVTIPLTFSVYRNTRPGKYRVTLNTDILQCSNVCVALNRDFGITVNITGGASTGSSKNDPSTGYTGNDVTDQTVPRTEKNAGTLTEKDKAIIDSLVITPVYTGRTVSGIIEAILFGIIAGLILNLMPCVLPVISLKVMALVRYSGEDLSYARKHNLVFSAGIIASFVVLAGLASFSGYKWGGLFQQKPFIIVMAVFVFAMSLSLFGVFTINVPGFAGRAASAKGPGYTDSFVKGVLATLLATPCSGPFLGGILAWTFTQPALIIFIIFSSVGLGMSLPYIAAAVKPGLARFMPAPGNWMKTLEEIMGFLLVFTTVYLVSLLDSDAVISVLILLVFVSMGLWQLGRFGSIDKTVTARRISMTVLVLAVAGGIFVSFFVLSARPGTELSGEFSISGLLENRDSGKITVVDFTAEWCPNCRLVEKTALDSSAVKKYISDNNIAFMTADITGKNTSAEYLMSRLGSNSIPFLAVFPAGKNFSSAVCLRDIYSAEDVIDAVRSAEKMTNR